MSDRSAQGSYHVDSFASSTHAEVRRLNAQVDLFWPMESALLQRHGLRDRMRILDCGCGPGRLLELLKGLLPTARCVGIEVDPLLVEAAQEHLAEQGLSDCTVQQGSAEEPNLPSESFDFVILRLVLEHVPDPAAALDSLGRLLRPGGRLAVISNDFDFHLRTSPPVPELDRLYDAYCASRRKDGGDPCIGRRVPQLVVESGLTLVAAEIELAHSAVIGDAAFLRAEGAGIPAQLVKSGFLDEKTLEEMTRSWRGMLETPGHSIARPLWVVVGERGTGARSSAAAPQTATSAGTSEAQPARPTPGGAVGNPLEDIPRLIAAAVGLEAVELDASLADLAIDSLAAIELQEKIRSSTGVEIPVVRFLADEPVRDLVSLVEQGSRSGERPADKETKGRTGGVSWEEGEL